MSDFKPFFTKVSGGGNDFIVWDNLAPGQEPVRPTSHEISRMCTRGLSVGADGVILIEPAEPAGAADLRMIYFNRDGGRAALCGNGVRCVARLAALRGHASAGGMRIQTDVGVLAARVQAEQATFTIQLPDTRLEARSLLVQLSGAQVSVEATWVLVGVPHLVVVRDEVHRMDLLPLAPLLRAHPALGTDGANVDFITPRDRHTLDLRCWERGVEAETLSSGSGCIASALAAVSLGLAESPVTCRSRTGLSSTVSLSEGQAAIRGDARIIYTAQLQPEAIRGFEP